MSLLSCTKQPTFTCFPFSPNDENQCSCECPQRYNARLIIIDMKQYLSSIVQGYGYKNVKEFLTEYRASKAGYSDYQSAVVKWEQQTGNKAESDSLKAKLQRKQQEAKELNRHNKHQKKYSRDVR